MLSGAVHYSTVVQHFGGLPQTTPHPRQCCCLRNDDFYCAVQKCDATKMTKELIACNKNIFLLLVKHNTNTSFADMLTSNEKKLPVRFFLTGKNKCLIILFGSGRRRRIQHSFRNYIVNRGHSFQIRKNGFQFIFGH